MKNESTADVRLAPTPPLWVLGTMNHLMRPLSHHDWPNGCPA